MTAWLHGLRVKLLILIIVPVVSIICGGILAFYSVSKLHDEIAEIGHEHVPQVIATATMAEGIQGTVRSFWAVYGAGRDLALRKQYLTRAQDYFENVRVAKEEFEEIPMDDGEKAAWVNISSAFEKAQEIVDDIEDKFAQNTPAGDDEAKLLLFDVLRPALVPIEDGLTDMGVEQGVASQDMAEEAEAFSNTILLILMISVPLAVFLVMTFGIWLAWKLSFRLSEIVTHISNSASEVGMASRELSDASHKLSAGASEAASSLEETVASLEELSSMVKQNADNSKEAGALSQSARSSAEEGEGEVRHLIGAMGEISTSSKKIEEIINVIDDIAFQTNLLALNAAVEAARAGDQGRGFAVVAEAVRTLAQRSSDAAKDINNLIKDSVDKVTRGTQIADRSGDVLKKIVANSKKVADLTTEIAMASQEQASGISQISKAMNQLDQATQSNAASAEETASTSQQLSGEADGLRRQVIDLIEVVDGKRSEAGQPAEASSSWQPPQRSPKPIQRRENVVGLTPKPSSGSPKAAEAIPFGDDEDIDKLTGF